MRKNLNLILNIFFAVLIFNSFTAAQSDYEIVQNFKQKYRQIEESIKKANTIEELNSLVASIDRLRSEYMQYKDLLDKSLYPDNFDKSFERLNSEFVVRNRDLTQVDILQTENLQLKEQVELLNKQNSALLSQIQSIEYATKKDSKKVAELEKLVAELKSSLKKRDDLIMSIVDSLMPQLMKKEAYFSSREKNDIYLKAEKNNVLDNVKRALQDNISFLKVTSLQPEDLSEVKKQQEQFAEFWQDAGVKLVDIYSAKRKKANEIALIDSLFTDWQKAVDTEAWNSIREEFAANGIMLIDFSNGDEFTNVLTSFIEEEIKNIGIKSPEASEETYRNFADSTWFKTIKPLWIPFLVEHQMIESEQVLQIEKKIAEWNMKLTPATNEWLYIVIAAVVIIISVLFVRVMKKKKSSPGDA